MKTFYAICASIFIALIVLATGAIIYIAIQGADDLDFSSASSNPLLKNEWQTADVMDENNEVSGQRGFVVITKEELDSVSAKQLKTFANRRIKNKDQQWASVMTPEGYGIYFPDSNYRYGEYGLLTPDGRIETMYATLTLEGNDYRFNNITGADTVPTLEGNDGSNPDEDIATEGAPAAEDTGTGAEDSVQAEYYEPQSAIDSIDSPADYINEWMGLQFTAPSGYRMLSEEEQIPLDVLIISSAFENTNTYEPQSQMNKLTTDHSSEMVCLSAASSTGINAFSEKLINPSTTVNQIIDAYGADLNEYNTLEIIYDEKIENITLAGWVYTKIHLTLGNNLPAPSGANSGTSQNNSMQEQNSYFTIKDGKVFTIHLAYEPGNEAEAEALLNAFQAF